MHCITLAIIPKDKLQSVSIDMDNWKSRIVSVPISIPVLFQFPFQSCSLFYAQVELKCFSCIPGNHSVCAVRTREGLTMQKILSVIREPMLSGFLSLNA